MTFRTRLLLLVTVAVVVAVTAVGLIVGAVTRRRFERTEEQRIPVFAAQFQREFARRGADVAQRVEDIAGSDSILSIAVAGTADLGDAAQALARAHGLDFLELVAGDGTILSSAHYGARFGYREDWLAAPMNWNSQPAFLKREELPNEQVAIGLMAVRIFDVGDRKLFVVGGEQLDREFLKSLTLPVGMRILLYRNLSDKFSPGLVIDAEGPVRSAERLAPFIEQIRRQRGEPSATVNWTTDPGSAETFRAIPLRGRENQLLGALLIGSSRRDLVRLENFFLKTAVVTGIVGILVGVLLGWWATTRVTRPVQELAEGARAVAHGDWKVHVPVRSRDEIGQLAFAFNRMTQQLLEQRDHLVQAERVAAWRELARRLAHELKNPLFPLQITVENMQRARERHPEQFDEVFREGTETLIAELGNLKQIVARFSDFAKMPRPQPESVDLNTLIRDTMKLFEAQLAKEQITLKLELDPDLPRIQADPAQIARILQNLVLNAIDAMPGPGTISVRTARAETGIRLEVADTGQGLTPEECERLFTPYYTSKQHGTGLGLAIVQSVVSDHGGRIFVESQPGKGTTFRIELHP